MKYLSSTTLGCLDIGVRKWDFVAKTQFLYSVTWVTWVTWEIQNILNFLNVSSIREVLLQNIYFNRTCNLHFANQVVQFLTQNWFFFQLLPLNSEGYKQSVSKLVRWNQRPRRGNTLKLKLLKHLVNNFQSSLYISLVYVNQT